MINSIIHIFTVVICWFESELQSFNLDNLFTIIGFIGAIATFFYTSRSEKRATEDQTNKERVRATLSDFGTLRREHQNFDILLEECATEEGKDAVKKAYLSDLERFAVGCNKDAYDLDVINRMSGGQLIRQYRNEFKDFITKRRLNVNIGSAVKVEKIYNEYEQMIENIFVLRNEVWDQPENITEERHILHKFLSMKISSAEEIFLQFKKIKHSVENHGTAKEGYLYVPGTRDDRCLLVAHADTVCDYAYKSEEIVHELKFSNGVYRSVSGKTIIGADDRAGCAMLWLLKDMGHSLLILDGEEHGQIGANYLKKSNSQLFEELNRHTFIVQLDRRGNSDYKTYNIPVTENFVNFIEKETGYHHVVEKKGKTDICVLCDSICGVNLSIGYHHEHKEDETLVYEEWLHTLTLLKKMLSKKLDQYTIVNSKKDVKNVI